MMKLKPRSLLLAEKEGDVAHDGVEVEHRPSLNLGIPVLVSLYCQVNVEPESLAVEPEGWHAWDSLLIFRVRTFVRHGSSSRMSVIETVSPVLNNQDVATNGW